MPRKPLIRSPELPYHVYNRVLSKKFYPPIVLEKIFQIYMDQIRTVTWVYGARFHLFVLMSNHFHAIIDTPDANIDRVMQYMLRESSRAIRKLLCSQDYRFQTRYQWELIDNSIQYQNTYRYVALNPITASMCPSFEEYRFSTLAAQYGKRLLACPIYENHPLLKLSIPENFDERFDWLKRCQIQVSDT